MSKPKSKWQLAVNKAYWQKACAQLFQERGQVPTDDQVAERAEYLMQTYPMGQGKKAPKRVPSWFKLYGPGENLICTCDTEEAVKRYISDRKALKDDIEVKVYQLVGVFIPTKTVTYKFKKV